MWLVNFFSFSAYELLFHCLWPPLFLMKSELFTLILLLSSFISFFLLPLSKFSLWLSMVFTMMCTSVSLSLFSPLGVHCLGCSVMFDFIIKFGKLLVIISSDIFSTPSFLSLEIPFCLLVYSIVSHRSLTLFFIFYLVFQIALSVFIHL